MLLLCFFFFECWKDAVCHSTTAVGIRNIIDSKSTAQFRPLHANITTYNYANQTHKQHSCSYMALAVCVANSMVESNTTSSRLFSNATAGWIAATIYRCVHMYKLWFFFLLICVLFCSRFKFLLLMLLLLFTVCRKFVDDGFLLLFVLSAGYLLIVIIVAVVVVVVVVADYLTVMSNLAQAWEVMFIIDFWCILATFIL